MILQPQSSELFQIPQNPSRNLHLSKRRVRNRSLILIPLEYWRVTLTFPGVHKPFASFVLSAREPFRLPDALLSPAQRSLNPGPTPQPSSILTLSDAFKSLGSRDVRNPSSCLPTRELLATPTPPPCGRISPRWHLSTSWPKKTVSEARHTR